MSFATHPVSFVLLAVGALWLPAGQPVKPTGDPSGRMLPGPPTARTPATSARSPASSCAGVLAGQFLMGSPRDEPERRPGEDQVEVTLSRGFWIGKYEVTQGQWKRVVGEFPGELTAGEGDDFPGLHDQLRRGGGVLPEADRDAPARPATCRRIGSSGSRPKRSGNTPAGPGRRPRLRSATGSAASRRTSRASRTTGPRRGRR